MNHQDKYIQRLKSKKEDTLQIEQGETLGAEREVVQSGCSSFEANSSGADVVETVLEEVYFEIALLFQCLNLLQRHLL